MGFNGNDLQRTSSCQSSAPWHKKVKLAVLMVMPMLKKSLKPPKNRQPLECLRLKHFNLEKDIVTLGYRRR